MFQWSSHHISTQFFDLIVVLNEWFTGKRLKTIVEIPGFVVDAHHRESANLDEPEIYRSPSLLAVGQHSKVNFQSVSSFG